MGNHAEEAMLSTVEFQKRVCQERGQNYYDDCFGFFLLEQFVHNRESSFYRNERPQVFIPYGRFSDVVGAYQFGKLMCEYWLELAIRNEDPSAPSIGQLLDEDQLIRIY